MFNNVAKNYNADARSIFRCGAAVFALVCAVPALSQTVNPPPEEKAGTGSEDIIVTARFRYEAVQSIGASITAVSGNTIADRGIVNFEDLSRATAGLTVVKSQPNSNDVAIRGVANSNLIAGAFFAISPLVTTFVDDVSISSAGISQRDISFFDLNRAEVLRGPQPTLFGEGAVGGAIRYFTNDPDLNGPRATGLVRGAVETIDHGGTGYRVDGAASLILVPEKLGLRVVGFYRKDGGFIDNPTIRRKDINDYKTRGGRAVLLARPTPDLTIRLGAFISRDEIGEQNQIDPASDPSDLTFATPLTVGRTTDDFDLYSGKIAYDFGPFTVTSISGYYTRTSQVDAFSSGNTFGLRLFFPTATDTITTQVSPSKEKTFSQEFRFVSKLDGPINFVGGLFYKHSDVDRSSIVSTPGLINFVLPQTANIAEQVQSNRIRQYSGFVEATASLSDKLRLIGGVRYVDQSVTTRLDKFTAIGLSTVIPAPIPTPIVDYVGLLQFFGIGNSFDYKLKRWLPRAGIEYNVNPDVLLYANYAKGVRSGNLNSPLAAFSGAGGGTPAFSQARFLSLLNVDADSVDSIDVGFKSRLLDNKLTFNVGAFYSKYKNPQIAVTLPTIATLNGPDQRIFGLEVEANHRWSQALRTYASFAWTNAEQTADFASFINGPIDIRKGFRAPNQPDIAFSLGYSLNTGSKTSRFGFVSDGQFSFVGPRYSMAQNYPSTRLGALTLLNLRAGVENDRFRVVLFVSNLLDDIEKVQAIGNTLGATVVGGRVVDLPPISAAVNQPRSFGIEATAKF